MKNNTIKLIVQLFFLFAFAEKVFSETSVVYHYGVESITNSPMKKNCCYGAVYTTRYSTNDMTIGAHLLSHLNTASIQFIHIVSNEQ